MAETNSNKVVIKRMVPTGTYKNSLPTAQVTVAMPAVKPPKPAATTPANQPASSRK